MGGHGTLVGALFNFCGQTADAAGGRGRRTGGLLQSLSRALETMMTSDEAEYEKDVMGKIVEMGGVVPLKWSVANENDERGDTERILAVIERAGGGAGNAGGAGGTGGAAAAADDDDNDDGGRGGDDDDDDTAESESASGEVLTSHLGHSSASSSSPPSSAPRAMAQISAHNTRGKNYETHPRTFGYIELPVNSSG